MPAASSQPEGNKKRSTEYQLREYLLLLATLVATVTYAAGLNLPGGTWQEDTPDGRHRAGDPILQFAHRSQYLAFYYCNATAFAASLVVSLLILVLNGRNTRWEALLRVVMVLDLLGLMGAYAAGSCRDTFTTIYSAVLVCAVFAYIVSAYLVFVYETKVLRKNQAGEGIAAGTHEEHLRHQELPKKQGDGTAAGTHEEQLQHQERQKKQEQKKQEEQLRELLMLLATFAVTITYVAGLNPPGGFWGDNDTKDGGHRMSDPVLLQHYSRRYWAFYVCNTTAFVASLLIIILLVDKKLMAVGNVDKRYVALYLLIITALLGLVGAYAAGSCREIAETIYVICLIGAVLAYIFLQVALRPIAEKWRRRHEWLDKVRGFFAPLQQKTSSENTQDKADEEAKKVDEEAQDLVMLLATLVASITYQAGLDPPGGLWPDDRDGPLTGDPILLTTHPTRYQVFFYSNSASFVASLIVIVMLQSRVTLQRHMLLAAMILDLFGLIGAYAAGSCRDETTSIYVVSLAGIVLIYVVIHITFLTLDHKDYQAADAVKLKKRRDVLLLLAILAATLTYQAGLTPPGGFWQEDDEAGHRAGYPVLHDNYNARYNAFFYCNAASFMASVALIVLLVNPNLYMPGIRCYALYVCMVMGMFGLMGAYAAGSSRDLRTSIYVLTLVAAVFAFLFLEVVIFWIIPYLESTGKIGCGERENGSGCWWQLLNQWRQGRNEEEKGRGEEENRDVEEKAVQHPLGSNSGSAPAGTQSEISEKKPSPLHLMKLVAKHLSLFPKKKEKKLYESRDKNLREYLMLLGVLAASVTYQSGLKPPGGLWQDNSNDHYAGNPILHYINKNRYHAFFYCNSTSFMASIVVIVLLLPGTLHQHSLPLWPMHTAIVLDMLGLLGAYAAGSTRDWKTSKNVIYLVIPVLLYIAACLAVSAIQNKGEVKKGKSDEHKMSVNDEEDQK